MQLVMVKPADLIPLLDLIKKVVVAFFDTDQCYNQPEVGIEKFLSFLRTAE